MSNNRNLIIAIVATVVILCCCGAALAVVGWFYGDQIVEQLGVSSRILPTFMAL